MLAQSNDATDVLTDKALGALLGGALGDAMGMPTQLISRDEVFRAYGRITGFMEPVDWHPVSRGLPAASITDDTEQTLLLCRQIIRTQGRFDEAAWARELIDWEKDVKARGIHDLLGPSTKRALEAILHGAPAATAGKNGTTNGAAMRIAPIGIVRPAEPLSLLIDQVEMVCRLTHNTSVAISGASAVAGAISMAMEGAALDEVIDFALRAAREGSKRGLTRERPVVAEAMESALEIVSKSDTNAVWDKILDRIGTSSDTQQSVPTAFAVLKSANASAWDASLISAGLGGDTDTIGAIAAAISGAVRGASSLPGDKIATLVSVNNLDLVEVADELVVLRRSGDTSSSIRN